MFKHLMSSTFVLQTFIKNVHNFTLNFFFIQVKNLREISKNIIQTLDKLKI